jgi:hypothetical protein
MALVTNSAVCAICGKPLGVDSPLVGFPAFVANPRDPIAFFSDSAFHRECFGRHPLADVALARYQAFLDQTPPRSLSCSICGRAITNPDEYGSLGYLTGDTRSPAFRFNYFQFHRACIRSWPDLPNLHAALHALRASGEWDTVALQRLVDSFDRMSRGTGPPDAN